uniref:Uncharacterized protein n=1 Tax=Syphacia muris TaxID=451379 RepID=A0A0N5AGQ9_9BILA
MKLCLPDCSLKTFIRILIITVTTLGVSSILSALIFFTVTSVALRLVIIGVGITLVSVSVLAWRLTSMDPQLQSASSVVYLRSYRRNYGWSTCQLYPLSDFCVWSRQNEHQQQQFAWTTPSEHWFYCPLVNPPPYEQAVPAVYRGEPPPIYTVSKYTSRTTSSSPPPQYSTQRCSLPNISDVHTSSSHRDFESTALPEQFLQPNFIRIIDCSKAEPSFLEINAATTAF